MGKGTRLALCCALVLLLCAGAASAATLTVQLTTDDAGNTACTASGTATYSCPTLRDAIAYASAGSAGTDPTVQLGAHVYALQGQLQITGALTIVGTGAGGAGGTVIEQSQAGSRVISDDDDGASLTIEEAEVTGGRLVSSNGNGNPDDDCDATGAQAFGGGICSQAPLTLIDTVVAGNSVTGAAGDAGNPSGNPAVGSAIYATDGLSLTNSTVSGNTSAGGAGFNATASLAAGVGGDAGPAIAASSVSISGSTIAGNLATGGVGGAGSTTPSTATPGAGGDARGGVSIPTGTVSDSTVSDNVATGGRGGASTESGGTGGAGGGGIGGGLSASSGVTITGSAILGNHVTAGAAGSGGSGGASGASGPATGGGIDLTGGTNSIVQSTIASNLASTAAGSTPQADGGGLALSGDAAAAVVNSTVFGNQANAPVGDASGGGVSAEGTNTVATLASDTLDDNQASASTPSDAHGGSVSSGASAAVILQDSILAGAGPSGTANCATAGGTITDHGHNLEDDAARSCGLHSGSGADDLVGVDPELPTTLGANGGPTPTLAPAPGSPVIGAGGACIDPTLSPAGPLTTDQRGDPRGASCDIGAFQTEPLVVTGAPAISGQAVNGSTVVCAQGSFSTTGDGARTSAGTIGPVRIAYTWLRDGAAIRGAGASTLELTAADVHQRLACRVTATGAYGSGSATSAAVTVARLRPVISKLSQSQRRWKETGRSAGTVFRFTLNVAAKVTLAFTRGRKRAETMTVNARQGKNSLRFKGRLSRRHRLAKGRYTVTFTATATGLKSKRKSLRFTIR